MIDRPTPEPRPMPDGQTLEPPLGSEPPRESEPRPAPAPRPGTEPTVNERLSQARARESARELPREGRYLGPVRITPVSILVALAFIGSIIYLGWVVIAIDDEQIPLLAAGFAVLGASFVAIAVGTLMGMWRAASRAEGGRALALALVGGFAGMAAIGCFTVTALSALVWST